MKPKASPRGRGEGIVAMFEWHDLTKEEQNALEEIVRNSNPIAEQMSALEAKGLVKDIGHWWVTGDGMECFFSKGFGVPASQPAADAPGEDVPQRRPTLLDTASKEDLRRMLENAEAELAAARAREGALRAANALWKRSAKRYWKAHRTAMGWYHEVCEAIRAFGSGDVVAEEVGNMWGWLVKYRNQIRLLSTKFVTLSDAIEAGVDDDSWGTKREYRYQELLSEFGVAKDLLNDDIRSVVFETTDTPTS